MSDSKRHHYTFVWSSINYLSMLFVFKTVSVCGFSRKVTCEAPYFRSNGEVIWIKARKRRCLPGRSELGTLELITFNPNYLIRISTVETFNLSPKYTLFLFLWISVHYFLQWECRNKVHTLYWPMAALKINSIPWEKSAISNK